MSINLQYTIKEGFLGLRRARLASFITVSTMVISLTLLSFFLLLTRNVGKFAGIFQEEICMDVFIDNSLNDDAVQRLQADLLNCPGVHQVVYISPDEALRQFEKELGEDPLEILGENPLPASFHIVINESHQTPKQTENVVKCLQSCSGVDEVIYRGRLIQLLHKFRRGLFFGTLILFLIVFLATLFLVSNTIRLTIYAQKEKINIMELVGATPEFIRLPYLIQGMLQGLIGGSIASVLIWGLVQAVKIQFPYLLKVELWVYGTPIVMGIFLGFLGSKLGVRRFLRS